MYYKHQFLTFFKWLEFYVLINKLDKKCMHAYQTQCDLLDYQQKKFSNPFLFLLFVQSLSSMQYGHCCCKILLIKEEYSNTH